MQPYEHPVLASTYPDAKEQIERNFRRMSTGRIDGSQLAYGIPNTKLRCQYQDYLLTLRCSATQLAGGWPATSYVEILPIPGLISGVRFNRIDISWVCTDVGAGTGTVQVRRMIWVDATASWTSVITLATFTLTASSAAATDLPSAGVALESGSTIVGGGDVYALGLYADTADATALTTTGSFLSVSVRPSVDPQEL